MSTRRGFALGAASLCAFPHVAQSAANPDSYAQTILTKAPVAFWRLGERSGPIAHDASGNGHDGKYEGSPRFVQPGAIAGDPAGAVQLDGRAAYIEIPDGAGFGQPDSGRGLSVEAWMRPDVLTFAGQTPQRYVHWLGKGEPGAFEWGFRFYSLDSPARPNRISAYIWNASGGEGAGAYFQDELHAGSWIHIVACYDPGDRSSPLNGVSIYRDGVLRGSPRSTPGARYASYEIDPHHASAPLRLGTRDLGSFFAGALDDVAVYPRALSAAEVADNYRAARPSRPS